MAIHLRKNGRLLTKKLPYRKKDNIKKLL
uniref:Uncharacterized protein n=1 Tax=Rhizophora mucronata TaxID=61149 RepID=A0A2P2J217_RHIMU